MQINCTQSSALMLSRDSCHLSFCGYRAIWGKHAVYGLKAVHTYCQITGSHGMHLRRNQRYNGQQTNHDQRAGPLSAGMPEKVRKTIASVDAIHSSS